MTPFCSVRDSQNWSMSKQGISIKLSADPYSNAQITKLFMVSMSLQKRCEISSKPNSYGNLSSILIQASSIGISRQMRLQILKIQMNLILVPLRKTSSSGIFPIMQCLYKSSLRANFMKQLQRGINISQRIKSSKLFLLSSKDFILSVEFLLKTLTFFEAKMSDKSYLVYLNIQIHTERTLSFLQVFPFSSMYLSKHFMSYYYKLRLISQLQSLSIFQRKGALRLFSSRFVSRISLTSLSSLKKFIQVVLKFIINAQWQFDFIQFQHYRFNHPNSIYISSSFRLQFQFKNENKRCDAYNFVIIEAQSKDKKIRVLMLKHSKTSSVYLKRRQRLFQAYGNYLNTSLQAINQDTDSHIQINIKQTQSPLSWLVGLAQILQNVSIRMQPIKTFILNSPEDLISRYISNVTELIEISISFNRASKLSNIIYFLCKRSFLSRTYFQKYLQKKYQKITSRSVQFSNIYYQNSAIILADMYLFGIYFTQDQMYSIINAVFQVQEQEMLIEQQKMEKCTFQLQYAINFLQLFLEPQFMHRRFSDKIVQLIELLISKKAFPLLKQLHDKMKGKLKVLQQYYSCFPEINPKAEDLIERKMKESSYIQSVQEYESLRKYILKIVKYVDRVIHIASLESNQLSMINSDIQSMPIILNEQSKEQDQDFTSQQTDADLEKGSPRTKPSKNQQSNLNTDQGNSDKEDKLLNSIYLSCKHFSNNTLFHKQQVYCVDESNLKSSFVEKDSCFCILQSLPQVYLQNLYNCTDIQSSIMLANRFLGQYNKHSNRQILVKQIFNKFFDRNNITYILKTLKIISTKQEYQINDLIKQSIEEINNKASTSGKIGKGIYGKFSNLCIQLAKFGLLNMFQYLHGLLDEIRRLNGTITDEKNPIQRSPTKPNQMIAFSQIVSIIERIGYYGYYHSLEAHIVFNDIINNLYHHIKTKTICYDVQTVNQFNGLISYLRNIRVTKESSQLQKITASQLKDNKKFWTTVKKIQLKIKQGSRTNLQEVCLLLDNSISNENYILSYLYADLIQAINSKILDRAVIQFTIKKIQQLLKDQDFQSSANWARFLGHLVKFKILKQAQFFQFLEQLLDKLYTPNEGPCIKVLSSALEGCTFFLKQTNKLSEFNQTLRFLLKIKSKLLAHKGLKNSILQFEIEEVLQNFHEAFKQIKSIQDCRYLQKLIENKKKQCDIEKILSDYELIVLGQERDKQRKYKEMAIKFVEKSTSPQQGVQNFQKTEQKSFQQLYKSASFEAENALVILQKPAPVENQQQIKAGKKIKVIGRSKNSKKIEKIEVTN